MEIEKIIDIPNIFKYIRSCGKISDEEMLRTFNCGFGFNIVAAQKDKDMIISHVSRFYDCCEIGRIEIGSRKIRFENMMNWL